MVIAIVVLLMAILMPTLKRIKEQARASGCNPLASLDCPACLHQSHDIPTTGLIWDDRFHVNNNRSNITFLEKDFMINPLAIILGDWLFSSLSVSFIFFCHHAEVSV